MGSSSSSPPVTRRWSTPPRQRVILLAAHDPAPPPPLVNCGRPSTWWCHCFVKSSPELLYSTTSRLVDPASPLHELEATEGSFSSPSMTPHLLPIQGIHGSMVNSAQRPPFASSSSTPALGSRRWQGPVRPICSNFFLVLFRSFVRPSHHGQFVCFVNGEHYIV